VTTATSPPPQLLQSHSPQSQPARSRSSQSRASQSQPLLPQTLRSQPPQSQPVESQKQTIATSTSATPATLTPTSYSAPPISIPCDNTTPESPVLHLKQSPTPALAPAIYSVYTPSVTDPDYSFLLPDDFDVTTKNASTQTIQDTQDNQKGALEDEKLCTCSKCPVHHRDPLKMPKSKRSRDDDGRDSNNITKKEKRLRIEKRYSLRARHS
jgi:hypothetical protein